MTTARALRLSHGRGFRRAELNRPDSGNPVDTALLDELGEALDAAESDPDCRVLVLAATGDDFCAGTDLAAHPVAEVEPLAAGEELPYWRVLERLAGSPTVTVAAVDGRATAGGVGLAAACDLVLAGEKASFRLTEALVGLVPAMALPFVARRVGEQRAFAATLLAEEFDAAAAEAAGLADMAGGSAESLLRRTLVRLGRVDRPTAAALKRYRSRLFRHDAELGHDAGRLFLERLGDPEARRLRSRLDGRETSSAGTAPSGPRGTV